MTTIPTSWRWVPLDEVVAPDAPIIYGILQPGPDVADGIPYVRPSEISGDEIRLDDLRRTTPEIARKYRRASLEPGDVLLSIVGTIGKVAIVPPELRGANITQSSCRIRPASAVLHHAFLAWFLRSPVARSAYDETRLGTGVPRLNIGQVREFPIALPPLNEQRRIVAKIDALMARSRRAKESLDAIPPLLERLRQSILAAAFRGDLTADWRAQNPDVEPAEKLLERIETPPRPPRYASRSVAVLPGDAALSVGNPDTPTAPGWRWVPLVDVARLESGHTPSRRQPEWWGGDVPWISLKDAGWHHGRTIFETRETTNELGLANSAARVLPEGTVCLSRTGTIGYSTVMGRPMATSQDFANWVCTEAVNPHWLKHLFAAERHALHQFSAQTTNIATIYYPELISFHVCLPPIAEQNEIVRRVEKAMSQLDAARKAHAGGAKRIAELDRAILAKAFRGELVPQDPNDEPAEQMLARLGSTETPTKGKRGRPRQKGA